MSISEATIQAGSYRLFYRAQGRGAAVVLIHGIPTNSYLWQGVIPHLSGGFTVLAPDLLGYGRSEMGQAEDLTLPRQAEHILAMLDALGIQQAHFVGHDLGGGIAQILLVRYPQRVLSVTVLDGVCFSNWPVPPVMQMRYPTAPEYEPSVVQASRMLREGVHHPEMLTPDVVNHLLTPWAQPDGPERLRRAVLALDHHQTEELVPHLGEARVPVTILWGQHDLLLPPYWGWRLNQAIPSAWFHVLSGCGHYAMLDDPLLVARHLAEHLARASGGGVNLPESMVAAATPVPTGPLSTRTGP